MHSIVVVGDVRTHSVTSESRPGIPCKPGGAFLASKAILQVLDATDRVGPVVYSYDDTDYLKQYGDSASWKLKVVTEAGDDQSRSRLWRIRSDETVEYFGPRASDSLWTALAPNGRFETDTKGDVWHVPECPDVVLITDLGVYVHTTEMLNPEIDPKLIWSAAHRLRSGRGQRFWKWVADSLNAISTGETQRIHAVAPMFPVADCEITPLLACRARQLADSLDEFQNIPYHFLTYLERNLREDHLHLVPQEQEDRTALEIRGEHSILFSLLFSRFRIARLNATERRLPLMEPVIIVAVRGRPSKSAAYNCSSRTFLTAIAEDTWLAERTVIIMEADDLRRPPESLAISTGLSWERTSQDTVFELRRHPTLSKFFNFGHLIVRYGVTGALHISTRTHDADYRLVFVPDQDDTTWAKEERDGIVLGTSSVMLATITEALIDGCESNNRHPLLEQLRAAISTALPTALGRLQELVRTGYDNQSNSLLDSGQLFNSEAITLSGNENAQATVQQVAVSEVQVPPVLLSGWTILGQTSQYSISTVATQIVRTGLRSAINRSTAHGDAVAPYATYGNANKALMTIVDRTEIEGFRAIQRLIHSHVMVAQHTSKPISIAVFGPPGSGKSTSVAQIIEGLKSEFHYNVSLLSTFNMSQMDSIEDLSEAFVEISNHTSGDEIPVAFFDEFDTRFPGDANPLGWLKYFLAPMEDGRFRRHEIKKGILVFAGGTSHTFSQFIGVGRPATDPSSIQFVQAKGPDFVSRLSGHLDIMGINPTKAEDQLYMIRRAVLIRTFLDRMQGLKGDREAGIDEPLLNALLHVPCYNHGGRSLRQLMEACSVGEKRHVSMSAVPPIHQLNMLVDGKSFIDLLAHR